MAIKSITKMTGNVVVEYDFGTKGKRKRKEFEDANDAKKFYVAKEKAGKQPKVLAPDGAAVVDNGDNTPSNADTAANGNEAAKAPQPKSGADKPASVPGVRAMRTRPYLAGVIVAKHGLAAGVTDEMVAELDEAYGNPNARESRFCLKNAWHACRAFAGVAENAAE